ncbi:MAG: AAC(3) family N-acetyltransferase [Candidatus Brocadiaceae bacterium]|nr:AAC(3) family N-acetyltransferase [Candidatus Brocadiaceae bacterium]
MGLKKNDLVFMHSGITGLGQLEGGSDTITEAFLEVLSEGLLVIPTFTYSWCKGVPYDLLETECLPEEVGSYSQNAWKDTRFVRSSNPNFSVAALKNRHNLSMIKRVFDIENSCFGRKSVFDHMCQLAEEIDGYILLLGGAHSDAVFRTVFVHYVEEKVGVPSRYLKRFYSPDNSNAYVDQLARFQTEKEYIAVTGGNTNKYSFPIVSDYSLLGSDLTKEGIISQKVFGYSETRMVEIKTFCNFLEEKLSKFPNYLI